MSLTFQDSFSVVRGRCFDRIRPKVGPEASNPAALDVLFEHFCSKIRMDEEFAAKTGHAFVSASRLGYITDLEKRGGSCTWGNAYLATGAAGVAARSAIRVEYQRVADSDGGWFEAQQSLNNRGATLLKSVDGVGAYAILWKIGPGDRSLLAGDGRGMIVLVTANSPGLSKMLDETARRALDVAGSLT